MSTTRRARPTMLALEPRFMFDAAGVATAMDAAATVPDPVMHDQPAHDPATEQMMAALADHGAPAATAERNEIVFVDTRVRDYASIAASVDPRAEVVLIDTDRNGVEQIREALAGREGLDAIHIVSHGDAGVLLLGNGPLHAGNLDAYADSLASIGQSLAEHGDIHLYGCDVGAGERGRAFVDALAQATGADIAASDDSTGGAQLGADWDLEIRTGEVTASSAIDVAALASFDYRLQTFGVANLEDLQIALTTAASNGQDDTITLTADIVATSSDDFTNGFLAYIDLQEDYSLTIVGGGYSLDADYYGRVVYVSEGDKVLFEDLTITRGLMSGRGGDANEAGESSLGAGIANYGDLALRDVTVTANLATGGGGGGVVAPSEDVGGGGGGGAVWGRNGGAGGDVGNAKGVTPSYSNGAGGDGGSYQPSGGGGGGSTQGGRKGIGTNAGGYGGSAWNSTMDIGGGGGGNGTNAPGGAGGAAVGGIFNASGATLTVVGTSVISNNLGAGGGGGGGSSGGAGGRGVGAIWNEGTLRMTAANYAAMGSEDSGNMGMSGDGGQEWGSRPDNVNTIYTADTAHTEPDYSPPAPAVDANGASEDGTAYATTFTEDGGAIRIVADDATIALDYDSEIASMTLVLGATPVGASEGIDYDPALNGNATLDSLGLTGSYDSTTGTYKITGTASAEVYQGVLRALVYDNTSQNPDTAARTVTITVRDAEGETGKATSTIDVTAVNDAPTMTEDGVYELPDTDEDTTSDAKTVSEILAAVGHADVDSDAASGIAVTVTIGNGTWQYSNDGSPGKTSGRSRRARHCCWLRRPKSATCPTGRMARRRASASAHGTRPKVRTAGPRTQRAMAARPRSPRRPPRHR